MKFIIDKEKIKENFNKYSKYGRVFYPVKANSSEIIIDTLCDLLRNEDRFFISNLNQIKQGMKNKLALMNPLISNDDIKKLYDKGCRFFVFDDFEKLTIFLSYAKLEETEIAIRISTMVIFPEVITNLGTDIKSAKKMLNIIKSAKQIGLQFYLNPELKKNCKTCLIDMLNILPVENIDFISIGGIPDFDKNIKIIKEYQNKYNIKDIIFEPGKGLVESGMSLETEIIRINNNIITIKNGIYSGFLDILLYQKKFEIYIDDNLLTAQPDDKKKKIYLFGGSADSADKLGTYYIDDIDISINSKVLIKNIGSYFQEFLMNYGKI